MPSFCNEHMQHGKPFIYAGFRHVAELTVFETWRGCHSAVFNCLPIRGKGKLIVYDMGLRAIARKCALAPMIDGSSSICASISRRTFRWTTSTTAERN